MFSWTVAQWQAFIYPLLSASIAVYLLLQCAYYLSVRPIRLVVASTFFFTFELATTAMLSLSAGLSPVIDFTYLRPWVVVTRVGMILATWWMIAEITQLVWRTRRR